ncbi:MAG: hypothetical protein AB1758_31565 [Candidatus Eremiobacterota bacterium]
MILALILLGLLLTMGLALMGKQANLRRATGSAADASQALSLAWAGLEDARAKLAKDLAFPPPGALDQLRYTYFEPVVDLDGTTVLGAYEVTVDSAWRQPPYEVLVIRSVGYAGRPESPSARRELVAELDVAELDRTGPGDNPRLFELIRVTDFGSL